MTSVVAVDGPAASGKTTAARGAARRLGFRHLSSGTLYRAVTWAALRGGWAVEEESLDDRLASLDLALVPADGRYRVRVDGTELEEELYSDPVVARVSEVSARPEVRRAVNRLVRAEGRRRSLVCDGRDVGATVFPDADLKVYLVAAAEERARRRLRERGEALTEAALERETARLGGRDEHDATREASPLRAAADAVTIDTTDVGPEEVVERIVGLARERGIAPVG